MGVMEDFITGQDNTKRVAANKVYLEQLQQRVKKINALEGIIEELDDDKIQAKTLEFRQRLASGEDINGPILEEAFAVVREASWYVQSIF
jgi:preprotein translocase subunit SecA